jgi:hypothetical protein
MTADPEPLLGGEALGDALMRLRMAVEPRRVVAAGPLSSSIGRR